MAKQEKETKDKSVNADDKRRRVSVFVDADSGALDPGTREDTRETLRKMLNAESTRALLGTTTATPKPAIAMKTDRSTVAMLYLALGKIEVMAAKFSGVSDERAHALEFTEAEIERLIEPTRRVLDKYDVSFGKYEDEFALAATLLPILAMKIAALRAAGPSAEFVAAGIGNAAKSQGGKP